MEEIKIDAKLIIVTFIISFLIGAIIWCGYKVYVVVTKDENNEIKYFEGDISASNVESIKTKESELINDDFFIQPNPEKKFKINNENPTQGKKDWAFVRTGNEKAKYTVQYYLPHSSQKLRGENTQAVFFDMSTWDEDGTYEDFIEDFTNTLKGQDSILELDYSTRQLNIKGQNHTIVMRSSKNVIASYFCLAQNGYACFLEIIVEKKYYDNELENTINEIFSTFSIL